MSEEKKNTTSDLLKQIIKEDVIDTMFSKPEYGWTDFTLSKTTHELSEVTGEGPFHWLKICINGLKSDTDFIISGDQEGQGPMYCAVTDDGCYVFDGWHPEKLEHVKMRRVEFCKILIKDLERNIDEWADWDINVYKDPEDRKYINEHNKRKEELLELITQLKAELKKIYDIERKQINDAVREAIKTRNGLVLINEDMIDDDLIDAYHELIKSRGY